MDSNRDRSSIIRYSVFVFLIGIAVAVIGMTVFFKFINKSQIVSEEKFDYYQELDKKYGTYFEIENLINSKSIYDVDDEDIKKDIIGVLTGSVDDKYIQYFTEDEYNNFQKAISGSYSGIGVSITETDDKHVLVKRVIEDSPAEKSDIRAGDIILKINGSETRDYNEATELIRGEAGTEVKLTILRDDEEIEMTVLRGDVEDSSVISMIFSEEKGIGYIRISTFNKNTGGDLESAARDLVKDGCDKIIIDLRNNGGGVMEQGVKSADVLLPACKIMTAKDAKGKETVYNSDASYIAAEYAILVNEGTASASEIFAGAMKQNEGAVLVGSRTYGKGVIQGIYKLKDRGRLKLTVEEYFLPDGKEINGVGIEPDIKADPANAVDVAVDALLEE